MTDAAAFDSIWLDHPTPAEQDKILDSNSGEWKGALSKPKYLLREALLADQDLTRDGGITFWALKGRRKADQSVVVLAACETVLKQGLLSHNGHVTDLPCHGVASVFGIPEFRGKGWGFRLINELAAKLPSWKSAPEQSSFSVLYSDIGKVFYDRNGWAPFASLHMLLKPISTSASEPLSLLTRSSQGSIERDTLTLPSVTLLSADQLPALCAADEAIIRTKLAARPATSRPAVTVVPDAKIMTWHHAREEFVAQEVLGRVPEVKGALAVIPSKTSCKAEAYAMDGTLSSDTVRTEALSTPSETRRVWAVWTRVYQNASASDPKGNVLYIMRICVEPRASSGGAEDFNLEGDSAEIEALMAILREAQRQAKEWNAEHVEVWNPSRRVTQAVERLSRASDNGMNIVDAASALDDKANDEYRVIHHRESDSITSLQFFDKGNLLGADFKANPVTIDWVENEKYAWN